MTMAQLRATAARYRMHALLVVVSFVVLVGSVGVGLRARKRLDPMRLTDGRLHQTEAEIANFRAAFKPSTPDEEVRLVAADTLPVAVPHDMRMSLAGQLASGAQAAGLTNVRVRFAGADSAAATPPLPEFVTRTVAVGDYTIAIDCGGSFAQVMSFVNHLPAATALQRITAARAPENSGVQYHLIFAVYEGGASSSAGPGGQHG